MKKTKIIFIFLCCAMLSLAGYILLGKNSAEKALIQGVVVAQNIYLSSAQAGAVRYIFVERGQKVEVGDRVFAMDSTILELRSNEWNAKIKEAGARLTLEELELNKATTNYNFYVNNYELLKHGNGDKNNLSLALKNSELSQQDVSIARSRIVMARADLSYNQAAWEAVQQQLRDLIPVAPASGYVEKILYQEGEWVGPNLPVVAITPEKGLRVRFYAPINKGNYKPGTSLELIYSGQALGAVVDYVRSEYLVGKAEPVLLVEAVPHNPSGLIIGQPVQVKAQP